MNWYLFWQGCGRYSENQHAIRHYETPRSEPHCLVINLDTWAVWWVLMWFVLFPFVYKLHFIWDVIIYKFMFWKKHLGVTFAMRRSSIPKQDIWLSLYPNCRKKHPHSQSREHRQVPLPLPFWSTSSPSNCFALIEQCMIVYVTMFCHCLFRSKGRGQLIGSCPKDGTYRTGGKRWPWGDRKQQGPPKEKYQERKLWKTSKDRVPCRERWCFSERAEQPGQHVFLQRSHSSRFALRQLNSLTCLDVVIDVVFLSRVFHKHTS